MPPIWISHRGLHNKFIENSKEAFHAAINSGFKVLETDLRSASDGHIVLSHDPNLERICGDKTPISLLSRLTIERFRYRSNGKPMFLDEFIDEFSSVCWLFDIKPENGFTTIKNLIKLLYKNNLSETIIQKAKFLFWNKKQQDFFLSYFPSAQCYENKLKCWQAGASALLGLSRLGLINNNKTYSLPPKIFGYYLYRDRIIQHYKKNGAKLLAFLPKTIEDISRSIKLGFNEILLDSEIPEDFKNI